jgi:hypothetical protein
MCQPLARMSMVRNADRRSGRRLGSVEKVLYNPRLHDFGQVP